MPLLLRRLLPIALLLIAADAAAVVRPWPGSGICAGTFHACANGADDGDTIEILTATPIDEADNGISKAVSVRAGAGIAATFAAGRRLRLQASTATPFDVRIDGLRFLDGGIEITVLTAGSITIRNNVIFAQSESTAIFLVGFGYDVPDYAMNVLIERNQLQVARAGGSGVSVVAQGPDVVLQARVLDNLISAKGDSAENGEGFGRRGIALQVESNASPSQLLVERNQILPDPARGELARMCGGISINASGAASIRTRIANNLTVLKADGNSLASNLWINAGSSADVRARIVNNTLVGGRSGLRIGTSSGEAVGIDASFANNLLRDHPAYGVIVAPLGAGRVVSNQSNAIFNVGGNVFVPGPTTITADPQTQGSHHRLGAASPLRNVGDLSAYTNTDPVSTGLVLPIDGDGMRRWREDQIDIGAFEYGDFSSTLDQASASPQLGLFSVAGIGDTPFNLQFTRGDGLRQDGIVLNANPITLGPITPGLAPYLYAQNQVDVPAQAGFHLLVSSGGTGLAIHTTTAANAYGANGSSLAGTLANVPANAIFLVNPAENGSAPGLRPVGAAHVGGSWRLLTSDGSNLALGLHFAVYMQPASANAFVHTATPANQPVPAVTLLDHPRLNGVPCASPHVSVDAGGSTPVPYVSAHYETTLQRWFIQSESTGTPILNGSRFFVLVDPRLGEDFCRGSLMKDGFE